MEMVLTVPGPLTVKTYTIQDLWKTVCTKYILLNGLVHHLTFTAEKGGR